MAKLGGGSSKDMAHGGVPSGDGLEAALKEIAARLSV
jgi:hypothetical protein